MLEAKKAILISAAFIVYYAVFLIFSDVLRAGMRLNTKNPIIAELKTKYKGLTADAIKKQLIQEKTDRLAKLKAAASTDAVRQVEID